MENKRSVFFISDSTAITAHTLGKSLLAQFENIPFDEFILPFVNNVERARQAVGNINKEAKKNSARPIVFCTLIDQSVRDIIMTSNGAVFNFFDTFISRLESELRKESTHAVGRYHEGVSDNYDVRIDAVNFAVNNDDGATTKGFEKADIILIGVSRTGKTPTCIFLGLQFGLYAANYPITEDDLVGMSQEYSLPSVLQPFRKKLFGLTINPERLQKIRFARRPNRPYSTYEQCAKEVSMTENMFNQENIPYLNVATISVEEIAATLIRSGKLKRRF
ncbi:MAG: kinase/pyrophosphorylase [Deltaproteobacteria bacterium]|nr:kinase/pyrophosphorylase [Deltaproteobacteria bacterium]